MFIEDPILVQKLGLSLVKAAEERDMKQGPDKLTDCAVETLSMLLELMSIRHRLLESASETAHLAQLRKHSQQRGRGIYNRFWTFYLTPLPPMKITFDKVLCTLSNKF